MKNERKMLFHIICATNICVQSCKHRCPAGPAGGAGRKRGNITLYVVVFSYDYLPMLRSSMKNVIAPNSKLSLMAPGIFHTQNCDRLALTR